MSALGTLLSFFALPADAQVEILPDVPAEFGVPGYFVVQNPLSLAAGALLSAVAPPHADSASSYLERTGLSLDAELPPSLNELSALVALIATHRDADWLFNQKALRRRAEWALVRRVASVAVRDLHLSGCCTSAEVRRVLQIEARRVDG